LYIKLNSTRSLVFITSLHLMLVLVMLFAPSCNETSSKKKSFADLQSMDDSVATYNQQIVRTEIQEIDDFILRYHWKMKETPTGLRYMIYKTGSGPDARQGDIVSIKYRVNLLNGDLVYLSDSTSLLTVEIGKRTVVSGLEEGIMLMKKGGRAKFIVPSHLAYGLLGDLEKIPARAALVYDVELRILEKSKKSD
jgi:FKBP-type peptidyl-prolyl cis-trans isomerase FkpA